MLIAGVDLAWAERTSSGRANETGVALINLEGDVLDAGWTVGLEETSTWIDGLPGSDVLVFVDAPLVVNNVAGQRRCDTQVGQRYGRWKVSCNTINLGSPRLAGVSLRQELQRRRWRYDDGLAGPPIAGRVLSECYPYTTLVGVEELGYDVERPRYKRKPKSMRVGDFRPVRAAACDDLLRRLDRQLLPPLKLRSHAATRELVEQPSPLDDRAYKHREDMIDALLCAWTGLVWFLEGFQRCQVLGERDEGEPLVATIIAPALLEQRRQPAS